MSRSRTIGTLLASVALGALTFFLSSPNKATKKKENHTQTGNMNKGKENLFI